MWLLAAFIAVPLIEIGLFIQVGGAIGLWPTLAIVLLTAVVGTLLVKSQGHRELDRLRGSFANLEDPSKPLAAGAMILFAGALLLTPGFFTDAMGLLLLIPGVRTLVFKHIRSRVAVFGFQSRSTNPPSPDVVDADFVVLEPGKQPTHRPSGWTRH